MNETNALTPTNNTLVVFFKRNYFRRPGKLRPGKLRPGKLRPGKLRPGKLRPSGKMNEMNAHLQITI